MTLREFYLYLEGAREKSDAEMNMVAWHAANLMSCWTKGVTMDKLLGKKAVTKKETYNKQISAIKKAEYEKAKQAEKDFYDPLR